MTTAFAYNISQSDAVILQRMYERVDFIYEENPIKIENFSNSLSKLQKKYKNHERFSYLLEQLSEYINKTMEKKDNQIIPKKKLSSSFKLNENNTLHLRSRDLDEADIISIATMLKKIKDDDKGIESISFSYNSRIGDS
jgi:biotin-(acetyl-CoA carboxylase) ligase